jgi:hypothetical protein
MASKANRFYSDSKHADPRTGLGGKTMKDRYRSGRIHEGKVARHLEDLGWYNMRRSRGSRGPADLTGRTPSGEMAYIQVKSNTATRAQKTTGSGEETWRRCGLC